MKKYFRFCFIFYCPHGTADTPYGYSSKQDLAIVFYKSCIEIKGDRIQLHDWHKNNIEFYQDGLDCVLINGEQAFYVHKRRTQHITENF